MDGPLIKTNLKKVVLRCTRITHLIMNLSRTGQPRSPPGNPSTFIKVRTAVNEILIEFQVHPNRWTTFFEFLQFSFFTKRNASAGFGTFEILKIFILFVFSPHLNAFLGCPAANSMIPLNKGSWACDKNKQNTFKMFFG